MVKGVMALAVSSVIFALTQQTLIAMLVELSGALVPLVVVIAIGLIAVRLVFFHTRRF
jgi:hypothetical protein